MIRVSLTKEDNFELLIDAIGYQCMTSMKMELDVFLADLNNKIFTKKHYRLAASQDIMAHLEVESNVSGITLELKPRSKLIDSTLAEIVDAYFDSKDENGICNPQVFSSKVCF